MAIHVEDVLLNEMHALEQIRENNTSQRVGAVIVFKDGTSLDEANRLLELMGAKIIDRTKANPFNPKHGNPVWYIP